MAMLCCACGSKNIGYDTNPHGLPVIGRCSMGAPLTGEPGACRCRDCQSLDIDERTDDERELAELAQLVCDQREVLLTQKRDRDAALATLERVREVATANAARAAELRNRPGTQRNAYDDGRAVAYQDAARDIEDALAAPGNFLIDYVRAAAPGEIAQLERLAAMERSAECVSCGYAPCMCDQQ
jgi:hypothetical protein